MGPPPVRPDAGQPALRHLVRRDAPTVVSGWLDGDERGVREYAHGADTPAARELAAEIGSLTKTFTAVLFADMCVRGEVSLDAPLTRFVPGAPPGVTLEHLATHTSRLPRIPRQLLPDLLRSPRDPYARFDVGRLEAAARGRRIRRGLGRRFAYSNLGYALLGLALSRAASAPYEELVEERICRPLGLDRTMFTPPVNRSRRMTPHRRVGAPVPPWHLAAMAPAGGLWSTVDDVLTWLRALVHLDDTPLGAAIALACRPRVEVTPGRLAVGLGWFVDAAGETPVAFHNGGTGGFSSFGGVNHTRRTTVALIATGRVAGNLTEAGIAALREGGHQL